MPDPKDTKRQTIYLPDDSIHDQIEWIAKAEGRSVNGQYVQMLREGVAARLSKPNPAVTLEQAVSS
jgi:hypothetical protein